MRLRTSGPTTLALAAAICLLSLSGPNALASPTAKTATNKAVVVKSFGLCSGGNLVWDHLNANWFNYGTTPITVDYSDPNLCDTTVTYAGLVASGADVMILSDSCGVPIVYSPAEIGAIHRYA